MARNKKETTPKTNTRTKDPPPGNEKRKVTERKIDELLQVNEKEKVMEKKIDELVQVQMPRKKEDLSKTARNNHEKNMENGFNEDDKEISHFVSLVAVGNEHRYKGQTDMIPPDKKPIVEKMTACMHVFSRIEASGKVYVPSLFRTGVIENPTPSDNYEVLFRYFESSVHPVHAEELITKVNNYSRTNNMTASVPLDELAYMYKASYKEWNEFMERVKKYRHYIRILSEEIVNLTDSQDLSELICHPNKRELEMLFQKKLMMNAEILDYNSRMIKDLQTGVLKVIKQWNYNTKQSLESSGLMYHIGQVANDVNWSKEEEVKQYYDGLREEFRMSKVIIVMINILAEQGNQAWHAVFNPEDRKQSMAMSVRIHDRLIKDPLRPFYDLNGNRLKGKGYFPGPKNDDEQWQQHRLNECIQSYSAAPWKNCEAAIMELFEKKENSINHNRPDVKGFRILLDPVDSIVYQLGGYVTAPIGTRIQGNAEKIITFIHELNSTKYKDTKAKKDMEAEERILLPMTRKFYEETAPTRLYNYIKMTEHHDHKNEHYTSPYTIPFAGSSEKMDDSDDNEDEILNYKRCDNKGGQSEKEYDTSKRAHLNLIPIIETQPRQIEKQRTISYQETLTNDTGLPQEDIPSEEKHGSQTDIPTNEKKLLLTDIPTNITPLLQPENPLTVQLHETKEINRGMIQQDRQPLLQTVLPKGSTSTGISKTEYEAALQVKNALLSEYLKTIKNHEEELQRKDAHITDLQKKPNCMIVK
jgi:hypothetical protein